jgi:hypothetical protein
MHSKFIGFGLVDALKFIFSLMIDSCYYSLPALPTVKMLATSGFPLMDPDYLVKPKPRTFINLKPKNLRGVLICPRKFACVSTAVQISREEGQLDGLNHRFSRNDTFDKKRGLHSLNSAI